MIKNCCEYLKESNKICIRNLDKLKEQIMNEEDEYVLNFLNEMYCDWLQHYKNNLELLSD